MSYLIYRRRHWIISLHIHKVYLSFDFSPFYWSIDLIEILSVIFGTVHYSVSTLCYKFVL